MENKAASNTNKKPPLKYPAALNIWVISIEKMNILLLFFKSVLK